MKRSGLILALCVLVHLMTVARADAALGWLDQLSGPGWWLTLSIETRLKCFGAPKPEAAAPAAGQALRTVDVQAGGPRFIFCERDALEQRLFSLDLGGSIGTTRDESGAGGLQFANGNRLWFYNIVPALSWRPIYHLQRALDLSDRRAENRSRLDFFDVGAGVGPYWFTASGLDTVSGAMVELYTEFHLPPVVRASMSPKVSPWIPSLRVSSLGFLGGFEPDAFGPRPIGDEHRPGDGTEWVPKYTLYWDIKLAKVR